MVAIKHPTIPDAATDVPASAVAEWVAQGWILVDPPAPPEPVAAPPKSPRVRTTR
jgi:hypothetical protein